ncbi:hypothetical protein PN36_10865 [Candidatus Thiomargarita nelsonii]|uniref:Uncharacterized protein n=1 Tax=Candidatus Thiomargarita nelsonii TaxID=1003181 RepID=A0A4E0R387_9GAMM|nr:hypothetical protein PN36_10865 [Candidatus Thiomargarita nelsonii]
MAKNAIQDLLAYKFKQARKELEKLRSNFYPDEYAQKVQKLNNEVKDKQVKYFRHLYNIYNLLEVKRL